MDENIFNDDNLVQNNWIKFNVIGDCIAGTLVAVREMKSRLPGKENEIVKVYEIKADSGEFHDMKDRKVIEPAIKVAPGEYWNVGGGFMLDTALRNVKLGTKLGIKFTGETPNKQAGFNPLKIKKVYIKKNPQTLKPVMDEEWLKEQEEAALNNLG